MGDSAEFLVIDELMNGRMIATNGALWIAPKFEFAEAHGQSVVEH